MSLKHERLEVIKIAIWVGACIGYDVTTHPKHQGQAIMTPKLEAS